MPLNMTTCPVGFLSHLPSFVNGTNGTDFEHEVAAQVASSVVVAVLLLGASLFVLLCGARLVKPTLFVAAFSITTFFGILAVDAVLAAAPDLLPSNASCLVLAIGPPVLGVLAGALAVCLLEVGFVILGAGAGSGFGFALYAAGLSKLPTVDLPLGSVDLTLLLCLLGGAILGSILICKLRESILIVATSALGAAGALSALLLILSHAHATAFLADVSPHGRFFWAPSALLVVLFAAGLTVQCCHAKKKREREETAALRPSTYPLMRP